MGGGEFGFAAPGRGENQAERASTSQAAARYTIVCPPDRPTRKNPSPVPCQKPARPIAEGLPIKGPG